MDNRFFNWLAGISYSLYLWHGLVISILLSLFFHQVSTSLIEWVIFTLATLLISLIVAVASVRWIELL